MIRIRGAVFAVDAEGRMSGCTAEAAEGFGRAINDPSLVPIACDQVMKNYRAIPAKDATGQSISSVQDALVRFSASQT